MPELEPSKTFRDALAQIEQISELSDGLSLVIVAGPATHAREMLERIAAVLAGGREVFWHPLDSRGALLPEGSGSDAHRPALLVHGLEWLADEDREEIETALNLSRDTLVALRALIVIWVDRLLLDEFRRFCPDLFHWRALLLVLDEEDLPLPAEIVALHQHARRLCQARPVRPDLYFEPRIRVAREAETTSLSAWATRVEHGCLEGDPGSGKSIGVAMFAASQARRASETGGIVPVLMTARTSVAPDHDSGLALASPALAGSRPDHRLSADLLECWAENGQLQLIVDGFDEILPLQRDAWLAWLYRLRRGYPRLRTLLVSRPLVVVPADWCRAEVLPWNLEQIEGLIKKSLPSDRDHGKLLEYLQQTPLRVMACSPILLGILVDIYRRTGRLPTDRTTLFRAYVETQLGKWDAARNLSRLRSSTSPEILRRQLAQAALGLLERGNDMFHLEDLRTWGDTQEEIRYLVERTGLIQEVGGGRYAFSHRALLEHFAAEALTELDAREAVRLLLEHRGDPAWTEVTLLAAPQLLTLIDEPASELRVSLTDLLAQLGKSL